MTISSVSRGASMADGAAWATPDAIDHSAHDPVERFNEEVIDTMADAGRLLAYEGQRLLHGVVSASGLAQIALVDLPAPQAPNYQSWAFGADGAEHARQEQPIHAPPTLVLADGGDTAVACGLMVSAAVVLFSLSDKRISAKPLAIVAAGILGGLGAIDCVGGGSDRRY